MKYNYENIGKRIAKERKEYCHFSQDELLTELSKQYGIGMSRRTLSAIENGKYYHYDIDFLFALCELFNCELGYLLCEKEYECKTRCDSDIYRETGLNEESIQTLKQIRKQDRNENSISLFPSELFAKMNSNEELTLEEQKQMEEIFFDTSDKYMYPLDSHRPLLMDLLNYMLASGNIEKIIIQFRNFVNARFKVPVYYDNDKNNFIYPNNDYSYTGDIKYGDKIHKGNYILNFASSPDNPNDNAPIYLSDTFFDTVTLKDIEKIFYEMRADYEKGHGD